MNLSQHLVYEALVITETPCPSMRRCFCNEYGRRSAWDLFLGAREDPQEPVKELYHDWGTKLAFGLRPIMIPLFLGGDFSSSRAQKRNLGLQEIYRVVVGKEKAAGRRPAFSLPATTR